MWLTAEPASVSLMPMQKSASPLAAIGSQRSFIASLPRCSIARGGPLKISWARIALDTSTRPSSSRTIAASMSPMPMPPYCSPMVMPNRSALRSASHDASGNSSVSSQWRAFGREVALGDLAGELAERLLVVGLGERIGALAGHRRGG